MSDFRLRSTIGKVQAAATAVEDLVKHPIEVSELNASTRSEALGAVADLAEMMDAFSNDLLELHAGLSEDED